MTYEHAENKQAEAQPRLLSSMKRPVTDGDLAVARDEWNTRMKDLERANNWVVLWTRILFGGGVLAVIAGGLGYFCAKQMEED